MYGAGWRGWGGGGGVMFLSDGTFAVAKVQFQFSKRERDVHCTTTETNDENRR